MTANTTIRLDKLLANAGIVSRRSVKLFLKQHEVVVQGKRASESRVRIAPTDDVLIDGKKVAKPDFVYFLLNKPIGIISSTRDEFDRDTVTSLVKSRERIYPVGRLDKETHGLVLLTNNGELTHQLIHPRYHVPKVYRLTVKGNVEKEQLEKMRMGVLLTDGVTLPAEVVIREKSEKQTILEVTLHEGRNRQIRRMCKTVGIELVDLQRIAFGPLTVGALKQGEYRILTEKEIQNLKTAVQRT